MEAVTTLMLERKDIIPERNDREFSKVSVKDFPLHFKGDIMKFNIVIFVDEDGLTKIIKHRYGKDSVEQMSWLLKKNEALTERYIEAEVLLREISKSFWSRLFAQKKVNAYLRKVLTKYAF